MKSNHNKSTEISWRDFFLGLFIGGFIVLLFCFMMMQRLYKSGNADTQANAGSQQSKTSSSDNKVSEETLKVYNTSVKEWSLTSGDGTVFNLVTPEGYYSLSDQYAEQLKQYYGIDVTEDTIICIGDSSQQYSASVLLTAATLQNTKQLVDAMYADNDEVDTSTFKYSEAYEYMTTGELPEDTMVTVTELESLTSNDGKVYRVFQTDRDTEYYKDDTMTETEVVHSVELTAYSQNEDALEVLIYMQEFDMDTALSLLRSFLN